MIKPTNPANFIDIDNTDDYENLINEEWRS
jgi:hypothetical protein